MTFNTYSIRRDNLISPWGVGALVSFPHDESLMVAGLDFWFDDDHSYKDFVIIDERLSKRLGGVQFVMPPDFRDYKQDPEHANMRIPAIRFPLWQYCPVCGNVEESGYAGERMKCNGEIRKKNGQETYCAINRLKPKKLPNLIPERFIAVCKKGHVEDFPIKDWVHKKSNKPITSACRLARSTGGSSATLSGVRYTCTCGASATMSGAFGKDALGKIGYYCTGNRPWLGEGQNEKCGEELMILQRGASNVWFAEIVSSVYIPTQSSQYVNENTKECVERGIAKFSSSRTDGTIDTSSILAFVLSWKTNCYDDIDEKQAIEGIVSTLNNQSKDTYSQTEDEYRKQEFDVLIRSAGKPSDELYIKNYNIEAYNDIGFLKSISLVHKLRETRVFRGFRRITPDGESELAQISVNKMDWLPAIANSGEGIMFEFDIDKLIKWSNQDNVKKRINIIARNVKESGKLSTEIINPIYVLLHTFSHCLINALASESGYSNASIREKIYCPKYIDDSSPQMAGVLIYTASGDSEGSLGGLVRQGRPGWIENVIERALNTAEWCSADPVCIQSPGQGLYGCNLAACHNCALLPETSCENRNMYLDRGIMIGTLDDKTIGFFNSYEKN